MRFVENNEIVGRGFGASKLGERASARQRVQRNDSQIASVAVEGIAGTGVLAGDDAEVQLEQRSQFPFPVAHQARWRHHEHPLDATARKHLAHRQAGHDGLAGAGIVRQQKSQGILAQHVFVHGDALVRQRIDAGDFAGEGGVELVAEG